MVKFVCELNATLGKIMVIGSLLKETESLSVGRFCRLITTTHNFCICYLERTVSAYTTMKLHPVNHHRYINKQCYQSKKFEKFEQTTSLGRVGET